MRSDARLLSPGVPREAPNLKASIRGEFLSAPSVFTPVASRERHVTRGAAHLWLGGLQWEAANSLKGLRMAPKR